MSIQNTINRHTLGFRKQLLSAGLFLAAGMLFAHSASAGSMYCGSEIISDGQRVGQSQAEILHKCGEPYSRSFNNWLYVKDGSVYRLRFDDSGSLTTITKELKN